MKAIQSLAALGALASTASAALPLVQSNQLRRVLLRSELLAKSNTLLSFADGNTRVIGSSGHNKTVNWIYNTIDGLGDYYNVEYQSFTVPSGNGSLFINGKSYVADYMTYSPSGHVVAPIVLVNDIGCVASDYPPEVAGAIALILRGTCDFGQKAALAGGAGAVGALIYNWDVGGLPGRTLGDPAIHPEGPYRPTAGISDTDGAEIIALLAAGPVTADFSINTFDITTYNVIAQTRGGDQNNVIHVGAHSDSVSEGPGINDNGSGSVALLEVAIRLAKFSVNNAVRFSWWAAEEEGLLGAAHYVESLSEAELAKIRLYLNFDMIASPNYIYAIYDGDGSSFGTSGPPGSAEAEKLFEDFFKNDERLPFTSTAFDGRSDYGPFLDVGIPSGGLFTGAEGVKTEEEAAIFGGEAGVWYDVNYHGAGDNVKNLNIGAFLHNSKAIAHSIATYARSWAGPYGIPPRTKRDIKSSNHKRALWGKGRERWSV